LQVSDSRVVFAGKQVKVIVIDTGFDYSYMKQANLCPSGHKSFLEEIYPLRNPDDKDTPVYAPWNEDLHGHGTNIVGLLAQYARADYCVVIYRYYSPTTRNDKASTLAWQAAADSDADVIVYSGGGLAPIAAEKAAVKKALIKGKIIFAAAGNEMHDLDGNCNYYPACYYRRIVVVGDLKYDNTLQESSNYGDCVDFYANGVNQSAFGRTMTGTSQANAIVAGKLIAEISKEKNLKGYRSPLLVSTHPKIKARKLVGKNGKTNGRH
jgi:subtilisin family serine protease